MRPARAKLQRFDSRHPAGPRDVSACDLNWKTQTHNLPTAALLEMTQVLGGIWDRIGSQLHRPAVFSRNYSRCHLPSRTTSAVRAPSAQEEPHPAKTIGGGSAKTRSIDLSSCAPPNSVPEGWHEPLWSAVDGHRDIVRHRRARKSCAETMHCSGRVLWGHLGRHRCLWGHLGGHGYHLGGHGCHRGGHGCRPVCTAIEPSRRELLSAGLAHAWRMSVLHVFTKGERGGSLQCSRSGGP